VAFKKPKLPLKVRYVPEIPFKVEVAETTRAVVEALVATVRFANDDVPAWETMVPVEVAPVKVRLPMAVFPALKLPPFSVRYVPEMPWRVVVPPTVRTFATRRFEVVAPWETMRLVVEATPVAVRLVAVAVPPMETSLPTRRKDVVAP
jgi:hypothetical protein